MRDNTIYVLNSDWGAIGTFTSRKGLSKGVDYWMKAKPTSALCFQAFMKNYIPGDVSKQIWAYVPVNCVLPPYTKNYDIVPCGINLVGNVRDDLEVYFK